MEQVEGAKIDRDNPVAQEGQEFGHHLGTDSNEEKERDRMNDQEWRIKKKNEKREEARYVAPSQILQKIMQLLHDFPLGLLKNS